MAEVRRRRKRFESMDVEDVRRLREWNRENARLDRIVVERDLKIGVT